jgi:hypothetical protein
MTVSVQAALLDVARGCDVTVRPRWSISASGVRKSGSAAALVLLAIGSVRRP